MSIKGTFLGAPWEQFVPLPGPDGRWAFLLVGDSVVAYAIGGMFQLKLSEIPAGSKLETILSHHGIEVAGEAERRVGDVCDGKGRYWRDTRMDVSPELQAELDAEQTSLGD